MDPFALQDLIESQGIWQNDMNLLMDISRQGAAYVNPLKIPGYVAPQRMAPVAANYMSAPQGVPMQNPNFMQVPGQINMGMVA